MDGSSVLATRRTTETTHDLHGFDARMRARLREALRERYERDTAKMVAADTGASPRTVEGWLRESDPQAPGADHLATMAKRYGPTFVAFVFLPDSDWARHERRRERLERLEREIAALKAEEFGG